eukprot:11191641-Lingulodinium_polyedra.AAC.1
MDGRRSWTWAPGWLGSRATTPSANVGNEIKDEYAPVCNCNNRRRTCNNSHAHIQQLARRE